MILTCTISIDEFEIDQKHSKIVKRIKILINWTIFDWIWPFLIKFDHFLLNLTIFDGFWPFFLSFDWLLVDVQNLPADTLPIFCPVTYFYHAQKYFNITEKCEAILDDQFNMTNLVLWRWPAIMMLNLKAYSNLT